MIKSPWVWIHEKLTTRVHGVVLANVAGSSVASLDVASHASRHGYLGADEISPIRPVVQRLNPFLYKNWADINGFTAAHTGTGSFTTGFLYGSHYTGTTDNSESIIYSYSSLYQAYAAYGHIWGIQINPRQDSIQTIWIGLLNVPTAPSTTQSHVGFYLDTNNDLYASSGNGTNGTQTDTGLGLSGASTTWVLSVYGNATGLYFYVNHVLKATHLLASSYYPNAVGCNFTTYIKNATDGINKQMLVYPLNVVAYFSY